MEAKESDRRVGKSYPVNQPKEQDRAEDLLDNWRKYGYVMFPQQRAIYNYLIPQVANKSVLEAGCGNGVGTAMMERSAKSIVGTDQLESNVKFCQEIYPWINFSAWDIEEVYGKSQFEVVVAVEVIEHVADPLLSLRNLIDACLSELWISTPNGAGQKRPPDNPYHVCEYTPAEMYALIMEASRLSPRQVTILSWKDGSTQSTSTLINPLIYRVLL